MAVFVSMPIRAVLPFADWSTTVVMAHVVVVVRVSLGRVGVFGLAALAFRVLPCCSRLCHSPHAPQTACQRR
jgi:hypothetical protein